MAEPQGTGGVVDPTFTPPPNPSPDPGLPPGGDPAGGDELGEKGLAALRAERARAKDLEQQLKDLQPLAAKAREYEDAQKTELERYADQLKAAADAKAGAEAETLRLQTELLRHKVAAAEGLSAAQARFLTGATEEEIAASVKELRDAFGPAPDDVQRRGPRQIDRLAPGALPPDPANPSDMNAWMRSRSSRT